MNNLDGLNAYDDLCKEIDILTIRRDELSSELSVINRLISSAGPKTKLVASYTGMPGAGGSNDLWEVFNVAQSHKEVNSKLEYVSTMLDIKLKAKKDIEDMMEKVACLEYKVAYLRDIERMPIAKIATKLGYSYDWIAKVSSKLKRLRQAG